MLPEARRVRDHDVRARRSVDTERPHAPVVADDDLAKRLRDIWTKRNDRYSELRTAETASLPKVEMSYIGG